MTPPSPDVDSLLPDPGQFPPPLAPVPGQAAQARLEPPVPDVTGRVDRDPAARRILIVDDLAENRDLLQECLQGHGYQTLSASNGQEALEAVAAGAPDLILLDILMPKLDGYEVCRRLKAREETAFIPIVMLTALQDLKDRIRGIEAGADDFLSKPFNVLELVTRVRSLLRVKALHDQVASSNRRLEETVAERTAALQAALRDLQEMDRLKSEFLTNISHELRTPLTPIKGYLPALLREEMGSLSPGQRQALQIVSRSVDRLHRLIDNLLTFMQWEGGQPVLQMEPVAPQVVCEPALAQVMPVATEKGVELRADFPPDVPPVWADAMALGEAIGHLLENAVKFTPPRGHVKVTARRVESPAGEPVDSPSPIILHRDFVEIAVQDTGIGIHPDALPKIFDRFYQADSSTTRRHGGTGLGLAIVRHILDAHGASIAVESHLERGTTFTIRLRTAC
jgi:signal transduction histidine kinase